MIILINGAFGSGKTSAANMLLSKLDNSMIYDPEEIGYMIRKIVPESVRHEHERTDDFQDIELWRTLTVRIAGEVKRQYNRHLIVPMTLYKEANFDYIYDGLKGIDNDVVHFCLIATEETIHQRLAKRGDTYGGWSYQQTRKCVSALKNPKFQEHIVTDHLETREVVDIMLSKLSH
ncbi:AAA family ATPase [Cohnella sp. AR92]|uniref:AAA family ATPase n=1 Tax=Cohnella sp. AR92 TaxID=648716 RepID=UPI000F8C6567|nr:AAA family ATPase [Cohnella sp. AR92]RUS45831.1 tunicamycin resistance protein [Cohnella sp. AR92]